MKAIYFVAINTFKEIARDKTFFILFIFAIIFMGFAMVLGQLTTMEQYRLTVDFGLAGVQLTVVALSIFSGSTLVFRELEKKTILYLLAKPISRSQFLLGKFIGLFLIISVMIIALMLMLLGLFQFIGWEANDIFFKSIYGIVLESMLLLSITMWLGVSIRPTLVVAISISIFLIGHWLNGFKLLVKDGTSQALKAFSEIIFHVLPNLENFNWRNHVIDNKAVDFAELMNASIYAFCWCLILISVAYFFFRRKDFV